MLSHPNQVAQVAITMSWFVDREPGNDVFMGALRLFHSFGATCVMNTSVHQGAAMVLAPNPRDLPNVREAAHRHRPTIFSGVLTTYSAIDNFASLEKYNLSSIRW